jgi:hypothetical protein
VRFCGEATLSTSVTVGGCYNITDLLIPDLSVAWSLFLALFKAAVVVLEPPAVIGGDLRPR